MIRHPKPYFEGRPTDDDLDLADEKIENTRKIESETDCAHKLLVNGICVRCGFLVKQIPKPN